MEREEAQRQLLLQGARAHGVGTAADLADYFRMPVNDARPRLAELVASGALREARVEGWREPAYLHADAQPARIEARSLLSPFDPVVWFRPRTRRLFGFDYRFEIFLPAETLDAPEPRAEGSTVDHLAHLLSLPVAPDVIQVLERLAPDELRRRYGDAIGTLFRRAASDSALVVVAEDVHWADESSVATLIRLLPSLATAHALLVVTSRPDPGSVGGPLFDAVRETFAKQARELSLAGLNESDSRELVANLLEIESLSAAVRA